MTLACKVWTATSLACLLLVQSGCGKRTESVRAEGSDTMVNLAQSWAERYEQEHPDANIEVSGGGSGVGIASLIDGVANMANASRQMKEEERELAVANTGKEPIETVVGRDALAVYVHADNPLDEISLEQLAEIYGNDGKITKWSELGVTDGPCQDDTIIRVSRQNNSGTYHYFREAVLGKGREFKLGSIDQSGSKDVVELVSKNPCAIGYSGMGYMAEGVKMLKISNTTGEPGVPPTVESATDGSYPIARPLYIYTLGEPTGRIQQYLDWIHSPAGQKIVLEKGYVPVGPTEAAESPAAGSETADEASAEATEPETTESEAESGSE